MFADSRSCMRSWNNHRRVPRPRLTCTKHLRHPEDSKFLCKPGHLWGLMTAMSRWPKKSREIQWCFLRHNGTSKTTSTARSCPQFSATTAPASKLANYHCFRGAPRVPTVDPGRTSPWWLRIYLFFCFLGVVSVHCIIYHQYRTCGEERLLRCRRCSYLHPKTLLCLVDVLSSGAFWRLTQTESKATTWKCCIFHSLIQRSRIP